MSGKIKKNYLYNLAYQILVVLLPLITTPYISHVLGSNGVGIFGFTYSVLSYFILVSMLGVMLYGRREIAYRQNDAIARSKAFWEINIIRWVTTFVAAIIYYFVCMTSDDLGIYYKIFTLEFIAGVFDISWYFQGIEQFKTLAIRNIIIKLIFVALIFIFIKTPDDLGLYIAFFGGSALLSNLSVWLLLPKTLKKVKITFKETKKHIKPILVLFLPQAMAEIYAILDKTMLGILIKDMDEVGIYEQSQKLEKFSLSVVTALSPVMASRVANLYSEEKGGEIKEKLKKSFHFIWALSTPIALGIVGIASTLVPWFLGPDFLGAIPIMQIGALLIFAIALSNVTGHQYLVPTKKQNLFTLSIAIGMLTNIIGNLILIPPFHAVGAIISSVSAECAVAIVQLHFIKKAVPIREIFKPAVKSLISGGIMCGVVLLLGLVVPKTVSGTFVQIVVGGIVYVAAMTILKDEIVLETWGTIGKMLKKLSPKK